MRTLSILILSLSFTLSAFGQESLVESPDSGIMAKAKIKDEAKNKRKFFKKDGKWFEYCYNNLRYVSPDTNAPYYSLTSYHKGKPYGIVKVFDGESGKLFLEIPYDEKGKENGAEKEYYVSGKVKYEIPYINDKINGIVKHYYESGKLRAESPYSNDTVSGIIKEYYENGKLESEYPYTHGTYNGSVKEYYKSGILKSVTDYNKGEKGVTINYDENGNEIK